MRRRKRWKMQVFLPSGVIKYQRERQREEGRGGGGAR